MEIVKFTRDSTFQRIKAWYIDENSIELSDKDNLRKDRLMHIWALRFKKKMSVSQAINKIIKEYEISQATAYRDYSLAMELFGDIDQTNAAAEKKIIAESYWDIYQNLYRLRKYDEARKALDSYKSLFDFSDKSQIVDPKKLEASLYKMNLPRSANKLLTAMLDSGVVDFNSLGAEDVDFQEVKEENAEEIEEEHE